MAERAGETTCDWCGYDEDIEGPLVTRTAGDGSDCRLCPTCAAGWDAEVAS